MKLRWTMLPDCVHRPDSEDIVDRTKAGLFLIAFSVIGILTIIEGINDGSDSSQLDRPGR